MRIESIAFVGVLLALPWPLWRLALSTPLRRRRRDQIALLGVLGGYGVAVLWAAIVQPDVLPVLAGVAALIALALWVRSRPSFGGRRAIPPGRLAVHPLGVYTDVDHLSRLADRHGPIFKIGATFPVPTLTPIICVVGHELGLELLRDHEAALEVYPPFPASRLIPRGFLRNMTVADHERYAPMFRGAFATAAAAESFDRAVARSAALTLASMAADSEAAGERGIAPGPYVRRFAFDVVANLLFGYEPGSAAREGLAADFDGLGIERFSWWSSRRAERRRWSAVVDRLRDEFAEPGSSEARSVLGIVLAGSGAGSKDASAALHDETVVGNVLQMQESGAGDLSALMAWVVKHLADHPVWLARLRAETITGGEAGDATPARSLGERIIRESLRLEQSEYLVRRTTQDIRFHGFLFPKGWRIRICVREAHRSPDVFDRPMEFDPDRFLRPVHPLTEYAPFGLYRHRCLAARLVQSIGRVFVDELARDYELMLVRDGPREHGRFHWQPSRHLRVRITRRGR